MSSPRKAGRKKDSWKVKSLRSTFGPQCLGHITTAPVSGFGSSLRDTASKVRPKHSHSIGWIQLRKSDHGSAVADGTAVMVGNGQSEVI